MNRPKPFEYSIRSADRWNKVYFPRYTDTTGKIIVVNDEPCKTRTQAEQRGRELQQAVKDAVLAGLQS